LRVQQIEKQIFLVEQDWLKKISERVRREQASSLQAEQLVRESALQKKQNEWEEKLSGLRQALAQIGPLQNPMTNEQVLLQDQILEAEEWIQVLSIQFTVIRAKALITELTQRATDLGRVRGYTAVNNQLEQMLAELKSSEDLVQGEQLLLSEMVDVFRVARAQNEVQAARFERQNRVLNNLIKAYQQEGATIQTLITSTLEFQQSLLSGYAETWSTRQKLPRTIREWNQLGEDLWLLPQLTWNTLSALFQELVSTWRAASYVQWIFLVLVQILWFSFWLGLRHFLENIYFNKNSKKEQTFSGKTVFILLKLLARNVIGFAIFGALIWVFLIAGITTNNLVVLFTIGLVWFAFKITIGLARLSLFENIGDVSGQDVQLYRGLRWTLGVGSILTMLTVLAHQLPIPAEITTSFDRLFMVVLLTVSFPLLKGWRVLPTLLLPYISQKPYLYRSVYLLGLLLPLTIFSNAIIGLLGYVNLAWHIGIAEGQFLIVFIAWVILRGLLGDMMQLLSDFFVTHVPNGWVWMEALLKPLHQVFRLILAICAFMVLFLLYGWDRDSTVIVRLTELSTRNLFQAGNISISIVNLLLFILLIFVVRWAARWSREFGYRWIFAKVRDSGLRNSLAVFTQYATVIIGAMIILRVIGIDLATLAVLAGALAVGIGFGLRDIANNLASGILLLIERPLRTGDIILFDNKEAEVMNIGLRATTVKNGDNMEVIIPNAVTVSTALTNLTFNDTVVRTVFSVRVGFNEDPHHVRALIYDTVKKHPAVLPEPIMEVFLTEIAESVLIFDVRYHIDLKKYESRIQVKSELLFAIYDTLKAAGIHLPYPHQEIEISQSAVHPKEIELP